MTYFCFRYFSAESWLLYIRRIRQQNDLINHCIIVLYDNIIVQYGVSVNPLNAQIAYTPSQKTKNQNQKNPEKHPLIGFHPFAVRINRINRTIGCPDLLWSLAHFSFAVRGSACVSHSERRRAFFSDFSSLRSHSSHSTDSDRNDDSSEQNSIKFNDICNEMYSMEAMAHYYWEKLDKCIKSTHCRLVLLFNHWSIIIIDAVTCRLLNLYTHYINNKYKCEINLLH